MAFDYSLFKKEMVRKSVHFSGLLIPLFYYLGISRELLLLAMGAGALAAGTLEIIRLTGFRIYPRFLLREWESQGSIGAYLFAIVSMFLALLLFEKHVAVAVMLFLTVGDTIVALSGAVLSMYAGRAKADIRKHDRPAASITGDIVYALKHHKSPLLMGVMFLTCACIGTLMHPFLTMPAIVVGALSAVVADAFPWRVAGLTLDDNLTIPLLSGIAMTLALFIHP